MRSGYARRPVSDDESGRLQCPFCDDYDVDRMYLGSYGMDSCVCLSCGARWDEDPVTGAFHGRATRSRTTGRPGD